MTKRVGATETTLRGARQSPIATKVSTEEMIPILPKLDKIGFHSLECWSGATSNVCLYFLGEDPWDRLRTIRRLCPKTKLQMLFRGQNMLGYRHYADDVLDYFIQRSVADGIDVIHIFDALNDLRNFGYAIKVVKKEGAHVQVGISYTTGPVLTSEYYIGYAKRIQEAGADSICIKDMVALLIPYRIEELVKALESAVDLPIQLHIHYTSGLASICVIEGVEAGVDWIDTTMPPLALGTSHAPTESIVAAFEGVEYDIGLGLALLNEIREYFMTLREKYIQNGLLNPSMLAISTKTLHYQVPGGMLSNLLSQLKQVGKADQLEEVLQEVPCVRRDSGCPPLVAPTSQIVRTQAVFSVITGERYKMCTKKFRDMVAGRYGKTPVEIDPAFQKKIVGDETPTTCRPADLLSPELETLRKEAAQWAEQEEDVLSYTQLPKVAEGFFRKRHGVRYDINNRLANEEKQVYPA